MERPIYSNKENCCHQLPCKEIQETAREGFPNRQTVIVSMTKSTILTLHHLPLKLSVGFAQQTFSNKRQLKNHLAAAPRKWLSLICVWCRKEKDTGRWWTFCLPRIAANKSFLAEIMDSGLPTIRSHMQKLSNSPMKTHLRLQRPRTGVY